MKTRLICKEQKKIKPNTLISGLIIVIIGLTFLLFNQFNRNITPKLLDIAIININRFNETVLTNYTVRSLYQEISTLKNVIEITQNKNDEIISVDFNLESVYKALSVITTYLQDSINSTSLRKEILEYYDEWMSSDIKSIVLKLPMGAVSPNIYSTNLGPRIPVKINYVDYIASSLRIQMEDYGINNVLVSIFIDCSITNELIIPSSRREVKNDYHILVASKIIQGKVPEYYGGMMETKSSILKIPIN